MSAPLSPRLSRIARWAAASIWLTTGLLVLHPYYREVGHGYLVQLGLPDWLMWATCGAEVVLALRVALGPPSTWLTALQIGMVTTFSVILAVSDPLLLAHPFGVITKNIPFIGLLLFLHQATRAGSTTGAMWLLRISMALIWVTEGLFPKILFQQELELDVVAASGLVPFDPHLFLRILGVAQVASGIAVLTLRGWPRRWLLWGQWLSLLLLPLLVSVHLPELWVHPFGPMTKNLPILAGTYLVIALLPPDPFMTARWSHLAMFHFAIPRALAEKYLPDGVELDLRHGEAWASFVCLEFHDTKVLGLPALFAREFTDVNLRIYAKKGDKHGVVFVREIASSPLVSLGANLVYGEHFVTARIRTTIDGTVTLRRIELGGVTHSVRLVSGREGEGEIPDEESDAHFFKEREWGFGNDERVYRVEHPRWAVRPVVSHELEVDFVKLYGAEWKVLAEGPRIVHFAEGSRVKVFPSVRARSEH